MMNTECRMAKLTKTMMTPRRGAARCALLLLTLLTAFSVRAQVPDGIEFTARYDPAVRPVAVETRLVNNGTEDAPGQPLPVSRLQILRGKSGSLHV